mgnify:CR=1 FL=1
MIVPVSLSPFFIVTWSPKASEVVVVSKAGALPAELMFARIMALADAVPGGAPPVLAEQGWLGEMH